MDDERDARQDAGQDGIDILEAARRLNITADGVRKRIRRGQLRAVKTDGRWLVLLPTDGETESKTGQDSIETERDQSRDESETESSATVARLLDMLDERDEKISDLERQRFELAGQLGYFQARLQAAEDKIKLLEAPKSEPAPIISASTSTTPSAPARPWWKLWAR